MIKEDLQHKDLERLIRRLLAQDQADRKQTEDQSLLEKSDAARYKIIKSIKPTTVRTLSAPALYAVAMILHHTGTIQDLVRAESYAKLAAQKGHSQGLWLKASIHDRRLVMQEKPQYYGTQYKKNATTGELVLFPLDGKCTNKERLEHGVPIPRVRSS